MTITFSIYWIPILLTVIIFGVMYMKDMFGDGNHSLFDLTPLIGCGSFIIITLLIWLVFFAYLHFFGG